MKKPHNKRSYNAARAIELHEQANKSDPFARARMSMTLRKGLDDATKVAKAAHRILSARKASIQAEFKLWMQSPERVELRRRLKQGRPTLKAA